MRLIGIGFLGLGLINLKMPCSSMALSKSPAMGLAQELRILLASMFQVLVPMTRKTLFQKSEELCPDK